REPAEQQALVLDLLAQFADAGGNWQDGQRRNEDNRRQEKADGHELPDGTRQRLHYCCPSEFVRASPFGWRTRARRLKRSLSSCWSKVSGAVKAASANSFERSKSGSSAEPDLARPEMSSASPSRRKSATQTLSGSNLLSS